MLIALFASIFFYNIYSQNAKTKPNSQSTLSSYKGFKEVEENNMTGATQTRYGHNIFSPNMKIDPNKQNTPNSFEGPSRAGSHFDVSDHVYKDIYTYYADPFDEFKNRQNFSQAARGLYGYGD